MADIKPIHTPVLKTIQTLVGTIVLEDPIGYSRDETNLYCIGRNGEVVWQAEKPGREALYNRVMLNKDGNSLLTYTITDQACEIDLFSGKLMSQVKLL